MYFTEFAALAGEASCRSVPNEVYCSQKTSAGAQKRGHMGEEFARTALLIGQEGVDRLARARVAVFGTGGVGGYVVEVLARGGVGALDLIDSDRISASNINRQILATQATVGQWKADAARERVLSINPQAKVRISRSFYSPETAGEFDFTEYDYVVDAIDTVTGKLALVEQAQAAGTPILSCMGAGNKLDPAAFRVADIYETDICPLARVMRRELRRRGVEALKVVYSPETPCKSSALPEPGQRRPVPGSCAFVPAAAGIIAGGEVIRDLLGRP